MILLILLVLANSRNVCCFTTSSKTTTKSCHNVYHGEIQPIFATPSASSRIETLYDIKNDLHNICESKSCLDIDNTLQGLVSHAPESFYVIDQSIQQLKNITILLINIKDENRSNHQNMIHDKLLDLKALSTFLVKPRFYLNINITKSQQNLNINWYTSPIISTECTGKVGLGCETSTRMLIDITHDDKRDDIYAIKQYEYWEESRATLELYHHMTCLELSHEALKVSIENSNSEETNIDVKIQHILSQLEKRLYLTKGSDLRGRTSADVAFNLALSGVTNSNHIFDSLVTIAIHELRRVGSRRSFKVTFILQIIEKFTISGASDTLLRILYSHAALHLKQKEYIDIDLIHKLSLGQYGLYSDRPLLWLWRFSSKQKKIGLKDRCASSTLNFSSVDWNDYFDDPKKSLVVDVGCGMGVSLLNLAFSSSDMIDVPSETKDIDWTSCNYVGADLNEIMVRYANGIVSRFYIQSIRSKHIHFFHLPGDELLENIKKSYPGNVKLIMLQFPSPYRLENSQSFGGNTQLPTTANAGFMVTEYLLNTVAEVLQLNGGNGKLLFQTKCEDIAVYVKNLALQKCGKFKYLSCSNPVQNIDQDIYFKGNGERPKRVDQWLKLMNRIYDRAEGSMWSLSSLLPLHGRTETEVACKNDGTFIHRCLLESKK